jgi:acyl-[acyl-carrier-protein]-phospholipid O-acyltransferase/long-chain-fatty-acid--[acyl-carrier-protein] ligase
VTESAALLRNSSFGRLWVVQFCSMSMAYGLGLASAVAVEYLTHSSAQTGLVIVSSILPAFLASLFAGAAADRFGKLPMLLTSLAVRIVAAVAFWGTAQLGSPAIALAAIYAANITGIAATQFTAAAEASLLPDVVIDKHLLRANARFQLSLLAAEGFGIVVVAPSVVKVAGAPAVGVVAAFLYLVALLLAATLRRGSDAVGLSPEIRRGWASFATDVQAGWRTIVQDRMLGMVAVQATLAGVLLLVMLSLVPGLLSRHLALGVEDAPFLLLPGGIGFALGLFLVSRCERRLSRPAWIAAGLLGLGGALGLLALVSRRPSPATLPLMVPVILGLGLSLAMVIVPARTVLQERPPAEMRGRVIAAQLTLSNAAAVLPLLLGGALADRLGIQPVMGLLSLVAVSIGAVGWHYARSVSVMVEWHSSRPC